MTVVGKQTGVFWSIDDGFADDQSTMVIQRSLKAEINDRLLEEYRGNF